MARDRRLFGQLVKFPLPGAVKTRLGEDIGFGKAACLYRLLAERVIFATQPRGESYQRIIHYSPASMRQDFEEWLPGEDLIPQRGDDLGDIMAHAVSDLLARGASAVVITGVDIPGLTREIVNEAFRVLDRNDLVIGPAADGGYYLIGMKRLHRELFSGVEWGTERVLAVTFMAAQSLGLSCGMVSTLRDIDRMEDLRAAKTALWDLPR